MSCSHSSLQLRLEYCLYERATGVKPVFLTSNHMDSDQSKIQDGDVRNNKSCITSYMTSVQSSCEFSCQIFINLQQLLNLGEEQSIWITCRTQNWRERLRGKTDGI